MVRSGSRASPGATSARGRPSRSPASRCRPSPDSRPWSRAGCRGIAGRPSPPSTRRTRAQPRTTRGGSAATPSCWFRSADSDCLRWTPDSGQACRSQDGWAGLTMRSGPDDGPVGARPADGTRRHMARPVTLCTGFEDRDPTPSWFVEGSVDIVMGEHQGSSPGSDRIPAGTPTRSSRPERARWTDDGLVRLDPGGSTPRGSDSVRWHCSTTRTAPRRPRRSRRPCTGSPRSNARGTDRRCEWLLYENI
jgi:hypothetical protein